MLDAEEKKIGLAFAEKMAETEMEVLSGRLSVRDIVTPDWESCLKVERKTK